MKTSQPAGEAKSKVEQELRQAERELTEALGRDDLAVIESIYDDDYTLTTVDGQVQNKAQRIAALKATDPKTVTRNRGDLSVRIYGDTAVVTGHTLFQTKVPGDKSSENRRFTHLWVKRQGRWRVVATQVTRIAGEAAGQQERNAENEAAIRRLRAAHDVAYNNHDAKALAELYVPDGDAVQNTGAYQSGRAEIEKRYADLFNGPSKNARVETLSSKIRFLTPDAALLDVESIITGRVGGNVRNHIASIYVKHNGEWLLVAERATRKVP